MKDKINRKVRDHCHYTGQYRGALDSICKLKDSVPKIIPIVFHNGSNYQFLIKKLPEKLGENTEKYTNFTVSIEK